MLLKKMLQISCFILFICGINASEEDISIGSMRIWNDLPSEVLIGINAHLSSNQRFAWYADPALDVSLFPGHSLDLNDSSLNSVLDAYCAEAGLAWQRFERSLWIYRPANTERLSELQQLLRDDNPTQRIAARNELLSKASPESLRIALLALGDENIQIADEALLGLHDFLRSSPDWGLSLQAAITLFGDPDWTRNAIHPFLRYHMDVIAPWAALKIVAQDEAVAAAIASAIKNREEDARSHLVLGIAAVCARLPEAAKQVLAPWSEVGGGWQQRYIRGRVNASLKYSGFFERGRFSDIQESIQASLGQIDTGSRNERRDAQNNLNNALSLLADLNNQESRNFLLSLAVNQEQPRQVRESALETLQQIPHHSLLDPLMQMHQGLDEDLSRLARPLLDILRRIDSVEAEEYSAAAIVALLQEDIEGLSTIDDTRVHERRRRDILRWLEDIAELRGSLPIAVFAPLLRSDITPPELRREICNMLRQHRHPHMVEPLVYVYQHDEWPDVRRAAALALGQSRLPKAINTLRQALDDQRSTTNRQSAIQGLALARDAGIFTKLIRMIDDASGDEERVFIIQNLGLIRHPESTDYLIQLLLNDQSPVLHRQAAASALSVIPTSQARTALVTVLRGDHDHRLQLQTLNALSPRSHADVPLFTPILLELLGDRPAPELLRMVTVNLVRCMVGLSPGHPLKHGVEEGLLALIADSNADNNARREGLEAFQYSDQPAEIARRLEEIQGQERNPMMRRFISRAVEELRK